MKKITTGLTAIALFIASASFAASPEKVSAVVKAVFSQDFSKAENVAWTKKENFYFAQFTLDNKAVSAAYDEKGELTGTSKVIAIADLPMNVSMAINKSYCNYNIGKEITELSFDGQTSYYFTAENAKSILNVKVDNNGYFTTENKTKK